MTSSQQILGPFDVRTSDLIQIDPASAVQMFRQLLVIEALRVGRPVTTVNVPDAITVADGGIDAEVDSLHGVTLPAGLISSGITRYQIKTGGFAFTTQGDIRSLLLQPKHKSTTKPKREHLQPRVLSCFEKQGTFVIVLFGTDLVGKDDEHGKTQVIEFLKRIDPAFASINVRIIRANQICTAITALAPGIALRLNRLGGQDDALFNDMEFLRESCDLQVERYIPTEDLDSNTNELSKIVNTLGKFQHIRVLGDAGAGKTHLIYRALAASNLAGCVLYCRDPEELDGSAALKALLELSKNTTIVLVADECELEIAQLLASRFKRVATSMLLVTADNVAEASNAHADTEIIEIASLPQLAIADIFLGYGIPAETANWLASLCEGSPRAAHKLGAYIAANPEQKHTEQLGHLDDFWNVYVCSPDKPQSPIGQERLAVVRTLALFRQLSWDTSEGPHTQATVLNVLQRLDQAFSKLKLASTIENLRRKRVLQGQRTLFISPKLMHIAMWKSWCETYGKSVDLLELRKSLTGRMLDHFDDMLAYARESKVAIALVEELLSSNGPFASLSGFESPGSPNLFFAVAQASPKAALRRLKLALENETIENRKLFSGEGRRAVIRGLEHTAVAKENFFVAVECLMLLAEAENESWSNNATGIFVSMFDLGYGKIAPSEVSPLVKIPYLKGVLESGTARQRTIVIEALKQSLSPFKNRYDIGDSTGLSRMPDRWMPKTYGEVYEAYSANLNVLLDAIDYLPDQARTEAAHAILTNARSLIVTPTVGTSVINALRKIKQIDVLREETIQTIVSMLHYEGKSIQDELHGALIELKAELVESSFSSRLRRYAGMKLVEDNFDGEGEFTEAPHAELIALAKEVQSDPALIVPELSWLLTDAAKNGHQFGREIGMVDADLDVWPTILNAWLSFESDRSEFFVAGYLSAFYSTNIGLWELLIGDLFSFVELRNTLVEVVWRSGMTDTVAEELLELALKGELEITKFRLFIYGGAIANMPLAVLERCVAILLKRSDQFAVECALDMMESRLRGSPNDVDVLSPLLAQILGATVFIEGIGSSESPGHMIVHQWNNAANRLLKQSPEISLHLAIVCIENFGSEGSVTSGYRPESFKFLRSAVERHPEQLWLAISKRLERPIDSKNWKLLQWLRGGDSALDSSRPVFDLVPASFVLNWIDGNIEERAWLIAEYCPPYLTETAQGPSIARQILERYGTTRQVRDSLHANMFTGAWSGTASEHFRGKLHQVEMMLAVETNANVITWLTEEKERLELAIEHSINTEELE